MSFKNCVYYRSGNSIRSILTDPSERKETVHKLNADHILFMVVEIKCMMDWIQIILNKPGIPELCTISSR